VVIKTLDIDFREKENTVVLVSWPEARERDKTGLVVVASSAPRFSAASRRSHSVCCDGAATQPSGRNG
jgi:hypothetical protein